MLGENCGTYCSNTSSYCQTQTEEGYSQLASLAHSKGFKLFRLRPKLHMLYEIGIQLKPAKLGGYVLSPISTCCWSDEDYIGKVSRVSRSCHGATQSIGAMRKVLGVYKMQFTRDAAKQRKRGQKWDPPMRGSACEVCAPLNTTKRKHKLLEIVQIAEIVEIDWKTMFV